MISERNKKDTNLDNNAFLRYFLIVIALLLIARQLWWALFGELNVDEFENLHIIWLYENGVMPYRDYYHTHLPIYNVILYPIYLIFGPSAELPSAVRLIFSPLVFIAIWQIAYIAYKITCSRLASWLAIIFLLSSPQISNFLSHIRPDLFGLVLALFAVMLYLNYTKQSLRKSPSIYLAGLLTGLSLIFSHKPIFLALTMLWFFERYFHQMLKLPFRERIHLIFGFCALLVLPFTLVISMLGVTGLLNLENLLVVTASQTKMASNEFFWWIKTRLLVYIPLFNLVLFAFGILGALQTKFWRDVGSRDAYFDRAFAGACSIIGILQIVFSSALVPHHFIFPFAFLSITAAYALVQTQKRIIVIVIIMALIPQNILDLKYYKTRAEQTKEFIYLLNNIPESVPVLDSRSGLSAFRVIVNRHLYYRPGFFDEEAYREYNELVIKMLEEKKFGAVILDDLMIRAFPEKAKELIERNYRPSKFPNIWIPKGVIYINDT